MNIVAATHDFDSGLAKLVIIALFVIFGLVKKAFEWWQNNRAALLEKFKKLDEEFKRRQAGESMPPPLSSTVSGIPSPPAFRKPVEVRVFPPSSDRGQPSEKAAQSSSAPETLRSRTPHPLAAMMQSRDSLRRAVVLKEVLGAPKALQTGDGHLF